jgi:hypothetical protein
MLLAALADTALQVSTAQKHGKQSLGRDKLESVVASAGPAARNSLPRSAKKLPTELTTD